MVFFVPVTLASRKFGKTFIMTKAIDFTFIPVLFDKAHRETSDGFDDVYIYENLDRGNIERFLTNKGREIHFFGVQGEEADNYLLLRDDEADELLEARRYHEPVSFADIASTLADDEGVDRYETGGILHASNCVQAVIGRKAFTKGTATIGPKSYEADDRMPFDEAMVDKHVIMAGTFDDGLQKKWAENSYYQGYTKGDEDDDPYTLLFFAPSHVSVYLFAALVEDFDAGMVSVLSAEDGQAFFKGL